LTSLRCATFCASTTNTAPLCVPPRARPDRHHDALANETGQDATFREGPRRRRLSPFGICTNLDRPAGRVNRGLTTVAPRECVGRGRPTDERACSSG
jgi:hypothetical protein